MKRYNALLSITVTLLGISLITAGSQAAPTGDWTYLYDAAHSGVSPAPVNLPLALSWKHNTNQVSKAVSTPAVGPDRVYFVVEQNIYAVNRQTGVMDWKLGVGTAIHSGLILHNDTLYLGADDGKLWAVDATGGTAKWKFAANDAIKSAPVLADNVMYFGSDDNRVYAFDLGANRLKWQFETGGKIQSTPVVHKDFVYVASQDKNLYALRRKDGGLFWQYSLGDADVFSSPAIHGHLILAAAGDHLHAIDAERGQKRWTFTAGDLITGTPAVRSQMAFVGTRAGVVYGIDTIRGQATWRFPAQGGRGAVQSSPVLAGEVLLCRAGYSETAARSGDYGPGAIPGYGRPSMPGAPTPGRGPTGGARQSSPATTRGASVIMGLSPTDGTVLWEYRIPKPPTPAAYSGYGAPGGPGAYPGYGPTQPGAPGAFPGGTRGPAGRPGMPGQPGAGMGYPGATRWGWAHRSYEDVVDASLCLSDGDLFIVGDDGILYCFKSQGADNIVPAVEETIIQLQGPQQAQYSYQLPSDPAEQFVPAPDTDNLLHLPGAPPIRVSMKVYDEGSGVDSASVELRIDDRPVPAEQLLYDPKEGLLWWIYESREEVARNYPDGQHHLVALISDWSGNQGGTQLFFVVDNSLMVPQVPSAPQYGPSPYGPGAGYGPGLGPPGGPLMPGPVGPPGYGQPPY